jgi:FMN-dependent NADH-azoreductase
MFNVLYLIGSPNPAEHSFSRQVAGYMLEELLRMRPDATVTIRDLYKEPPFLLNADYLAALRKLQQQQVLAPQEAMAMAEVMKEVEQFLACNHYVVATPLWNFGVPPMLKAYIDNIVVPEKTFRYTAVGPIGLMGGTGRKLVVVQASGGEFNEGPARTLNHGSRYLEDIFKFIGIDQIDIVTITGTALPTFDSRKVQAAKAQGLRLLQEVWLSGSNTAVYADRITSLGGQAAQGPAQMPEWTINSAH